MIVVAVAVVVTVVVVVVVVVVIVVVMVVVIVEWPSQLLTYSLAPAQADDWERRLNARG